jgi:glycosyltransferase involved in cell wall biosynthesis
MLYEYGNISDLADKLIQILKNEELYDSLSQGAVQWAKSFSWDDSAELMIQYCNDIIEKSQK